MKTLFEAIEEYVVARLELYQASTEVDGAGYSSSCHHERQKAEIAKKELEEICKKSQDRMSQPHNKTRYGELWPQEKIDACLTELEELKFHVILSGGWAWHFMSPTGHRELKHAHDHKDIDIFVKPEDVGTVIGILSSRGFQKVHTVYDRLKDNDGFRRYEKVSQYAADTAFRITIDFFVRKDILPICVNGWQMVSPKQLLTFYSNIHTSDKCFAVKAASDLLARGIEPVGHEELVQIPPKEK